MKRNLILLVLLTIIMGSCEDENNLKRELLIQSWILEETTLNGNENYAEALYYKNNIYTFYQDESLQIVIAQSLDIINGSWTLDESNSILTIALSGVMHQYKIERIDSNNLWLSLKVESNIYLYKYTKVPIE